MIRSFVGPPALALFIMLAPSSGPAPDPATTAAEVPTSPLPEASCDVSTSGKDEAVRA